MADVAAKIDACFGSYPRHSFAKGQLLLLAGENPPHIFYIKRGQVRQYDLTNRGDEVIVNIFKPPAFFPMSWAVNQTDNRYFYKAETGVEVHAVPVEAVLRFLQDNPDVMFDLLSRLYRGIDGLLGRMIQLMSATARSRLAYELVIECRRFGEPLPGGGYRLQLTESDLAARAGLSRETVSRELQKIKQRGIVSLEAKQLIVSDLPALQKLQTN